MGTKRILCALLSLALCLGLCACSGDKNPETVSVQSVSMITGIGPVGLAERFAGVVEAGESVRVDKGEQLQVKELLVAVGDMVEEGQPLFTYDVEAMRLELDKLSLELEQMKASVSTKNGQIEELEKEKAKAKSEDQLSYTLQIQELQIDVTETGLNITAKEKEIERLETLLENDRVLSPASGRIKSINENGGADERGNPLPFLSIQQTESFRVKGNINEQNAAALTPGMPVTIRSRVDDSIWTGTIDNVDWENPVQSESGYYYGVGKGEMESSSKYPFYITLDDDAGLKLGQHVYIEPGIRDSAESRLMLPAWFISDPDSNPWVWAANGDEKLEKRTVELGEYDADTQCWEIRSGLKLQDYLATPDDNCREGAPVVYYSESDFERPDPEDFGKIDFGGDQEKENEGGNYAVMPEDGEIGFKDGEFGYEDGEFGYEGGEDGMPIFEGAVVGEGEGGQVIYGGAEIPAGGEDGFALPTVSPEAGGAAG